MRCRLGWWCIGLVLGSAACHGRPSPSAPGPDGRATVQEIPLAPPPRAAEVPAKPSSNAASIVDEERPHVFDGRRANPGMANLRAVNEREAWLAFSVVDGLSYDAIVNLETGCVTETFDAGGVGGLDRLFDGTSDHQIRVGLMSEEGQRALGAHLALLARFDHNEVSAVMVRGHSDGAAAVSKDHRKLAMATRGRVFLSVDGGRRFERADSDSAATVEALHFSADDRYLVYGSYGQRPQTREVAILDTAAALPATPVKVSTEQFTPLQVSSPEGLLLFAHQSERCIYGVDPAAPALKQLSCIAGPKIAKDHFFYVSLSPSGRVGMEIQGDFQATRGIVFAVDGKTKPRQLKGAFDLHNAHVGPDDEGRVAWEKGAGTLRIDSPGGVHDTRMKGTPLGFDLQGNVLLFQQPPLVRPHKPMTRMPPAKGTLEDTRCTLVHRAASK